MLLSKQSLTEAYHAYKRNKVHSSNKLSYTSIKYYKSLCLVRKELLIVVLCSWILLCFIVSCLVFPSLLTKLEQSSGGAIVGLLDLIRFVLFNLVTVSFSLVSYWLSPNVI